MNKKKIGLAVTVVPVLAAGTVAMASAYKSGTDFKPFKNDQEIQTNQVVFDGDEPGVNQKKKSDNKESSLLKDKKDEKEKQGTELKDQADYLFENEKVNTKSVGIVDENNTGSQPLEPTEEQQEPEESYNIVKDSSKADTELNGTAQNSGGSSGNGSSSDRSDANGSNSSDNKNNSSKTDNNKTPTPTKTPDSNSGEDNNTNNTPKVTPTPAPVPTTTPSRPSSSIKDPESTKSNPTIGGGGSGQIPFKPYVDGVTPASDYENGDSKSIVIQQSGYNSGSILYEGQSVSKRDIYNSLDTLVYGNDGNGYLWGADALDKYIRIDAVSFDGGETWLDEFPQTIPENIGEGKMIIKVSYRMSTEDSNWKQRLVSYTPKENRIFVLSERVDEDTQVIVEDQILNSEQHPDLGTKINLFRYLDDMIKGDELTSLFPGWEEDGKLVPWLYTVTRGRHILEPADTVALDTSKYKAKIVYEWMSDNYEVGDEYMNLCYLQTLTGFTEDVQESYYNGIDRRRYRKVTVPEYIQAVIIDAGSELSTDYLELPDSVLYVEDTYNGLEVDEGYLVSSDNKSYSATDEGVLANKDQTSYLAIPCKMEKLTVPETVTNVSLTSENNLEELRLEARTMELMPEISYQRLHDCKTIIDDALLEDFIEKNNTALTEGKNNTVASEEEPDITYIVENEGIINNKGELRRVFHTGRTTYVLSNNVTAVQEGAFASRDGISVLLMPENGKTVEFKADCLQGSKISTIRCYSEEQYDSVLEQLDKTGASDEISVELTARAKEGYHYCIAQKDGEESVILIDAPKDITYFDGSVTEEDGTALTITTIDDNAFENCTDLVWAILPESVEEIGYRAFNNCTSLQGVLINNRDTITIASLAFDNCGSLRFIASNAMTGILEDDSVPKLTDSVGNCLVYVPTNAEGYSLRCVNFTEESGVYGYDAVDVGGGSRILYGLDENGRPWLVIRSGLEMPDQVTLPLSTQEIFCFAMENTYSESGSFTLNWDDLWGLWAFDSGAFANSQLGGDIVLQDNPYVGSEVFVGCRNITSAVVPGYSIQFADGVFTECSSLTSVTLGDFGLNSYLYSNVFYECNSLQDITFTGGAPELSVFGTQPFCFNSSWTREEEMEHIKVHVQEDQKSAFAKKWRYLFCGYYELGSDTAYLRMWSDIQWEFIDWNTWEFLPDEQIDSILEQRLLESENNIRTMIGAELVAEPTDFYPYRYDANEYEVTLIGAPSYIQELDIEAEKENMELPPATSVNYIASGAFSKCSNLSSVTIPFTVSGIHENAFSGVNSEKLVLNFQSETPLALMRDSEDAAYSFGVDDSKLEIHVPEGCEDAYITEWRYALSGYADLEAVKQAVTNDLTGEDGTVPTEEEIEKETANRLLPAENRLRVMMGLEPVEAGGTETLSEEIFNDGVQKENEEIQETEETDDSISFEIPAEDESVEDPEQDNAEEDGSEDTEDTSQDAEAETETDVEASVENKEETEK